MTRLATSHTFWRQTVEVFGHNGLFSYQSGGEFDNAGNRAWRPFPLHGRRSHGSPASASEHDLQAPEAGQTSRRRQPYAQIFTLLISRQTRFCSVNNQDRRWYLNKSSFKQIQDAISSVFSG